MTITLTTRVITIAIIITTVAFAIAIAICIPIAIAVGIHILILVLVFFIAITISMDITITERIINIIVIRFLLLISFINLLCWVLWGVFWGMLVIFCRDLWVKNGLRKIKNKCINDTI